MVSNQASRCQANNVATILLVHLDNLETAYRLGCITVENF